MNSKSQNKQSPNIELLDKAIKIIQEHPEHWNQEYWHCGTSHCLAGHIYLLLKDLPYDFMANPSDKDIENTSEIAREALNVSVQDFLYLTHASNTIDDIIRVRNRLAKDN